MEEHNYIVYMHICPNNKKYIGITKQLPEKRWLNGKGYKTNDYFYKAIKKYNWKNIEHKILYTNLTKHEAEEKEIELINKYKSNNTNYGYNIENGGHVNCVNEKTKKQISKTMKDKEIYKKNPNCFKKGEKSWITGKHHTEETKRIIKEKRANQIMSSNKVKCIETNIIYNSAKEIENIFGYNAKFIRKVCCDINKSAYNYHWIYINPKNRKNKIYK